MSGQEIYEKAKSDCQYNIDNNIKTPTFYMNRYKDAIIEQDYEIAKAITEVLKPLNYDTSFTHRHIRAIN